MRVHLKISHFPLSLSFDWTSPYLEFLIQPDVDLRRFRRTPCYTIFVL